MRGAFLATLLAVAMVEGCEQRSSPPVTPTSTNVVNAPTASEAGSLGPSHPPAGEVWRYSYEIVNTYPHDRAAFTQGLVFLDGKLIESTGLYGESSLREVELTTGKVLRQVPVSNQYFAEGLAILKGRAYQLTWQAQKGFVYEESTFRAEREFTYAGEGWGLATDGQSLILSDGTPQIRFLNPETFEVTRSIQAMYRGQALNRLNELEYIRGEIFANVWQSDFVVRIDPGNGAVIGIIDFSNLLPPADRQPTTDVLNGIAYDRAGDRLFVTGKLWPKLFQVRLKRVQ